MTNNTLGEYIARLLHDEYEKQAKIHGWKTQESCQVNFDDLPEKNKKVMYAVGQALADRLMKGELIERNR